MSDPDQNGDLLRTGEIADLLGMKQPNVHSFLRHRKIKPVGRDPKRGWRLYSRAVIEQARDEWLASRDRAGDAKRRAAAVANAERRTAA